MPRRPLDDGDRRSIRRALAAGHAVRETARQHGISPKAVRNVRDSRPKPAKKTRTQHLIALRRRRVKKAALATHTVNGLRTRKFASAAAIAAHLGRVSAETVRRDLDALGFRARVRPKVPAHTPDHVARRLAFCKKILSGPRVYDRIVFTDEKVFNTNRQASRLEWVEPGQKPTPQHNMKWAPSVAVWGAIGYNFRALHFFKQGEKIDSDVYCKVVEKFGFCLRNGGFLMQQDNAKPHVSVKSLAWTRGIGINLFETWPANSPDLSPIENYWEYIAKKAAEQRPQNRQQLIDAVRLAWDSAPAQVVNKFVLSFEAKIKNCKSKKGGY